MKITLLGTGTSSGVPVIGCHCPVCMSSDPRDRRTRTSALFETESTRIIIDCGPDFREQMIPQTFRRLNAVFVTHEHYDHVGGLDDLRPLCVFGDIDVYADPLAASRLRQRIPYCFVESKYPGVPNINLYDMHPHEVVTVGDIAVQAISVMHGKLPILGFRIGNVAYITDMKTLPDTEWELLQGIELLIVNGLRYATHATHQSVEEACQFSEKLGSPETWLVHMSHHVGLHSEVDNQLPEHVHLAFDGKTFNVDYDGVRTLS
ncbi:MAG: MBL fold metallo-hydrolase [Bacteroidaceae bacterium]|nr:MBL fold metallo-hydrolase [Bacteroidaceae bacterium]